LVNIDADFKLLDAAVANENDCAEYYIEKLEDVRYRAMELSGSDSVLALEMDVLISSFNDDIILATEAYKKKRRSFIDGIIDSLWSSLEVLFSTATYKDIGDDLKSVFKTHQDQVDKLEDLKEQIKRVKNSDAIELSDDRSGRIVASYMARNDKFTMGGYVKYINEYYKMIKDGLIETAIDGVYDSLVQSTGNEKRIAKHKQSLTFLEGYKNLETDDFIFRDSRIAVPYRITYSTLDIAQIIQGDTDRTKDGMDYYLHNIKIPEDLYVGKDLKVTKEDLLNLIDSAIEIHKQTKGKLLKVNTRSIAKEFLKSVRSNIATVGYVAAFGVLALRRVIRQVTKAGSWTVGVTSAYVGVSSDVGNILYLAEKLSKLYISKQ